MKSGNSTQIGVLLKRLWLHLSRRRQQQLQLLLCLMMVNAWLELVSLGAVLPFLGVLVSPERVFDNQAISSIASNFGLTSPNQLILPITVIFVLAAVLAGVTRMLVLWLSTRLAFASGADFSYEIYRRTLYQPYSIHISRNSSEVISGITAKVAIAISVINQSLIFVSSTVVMIMMLVALMLINPVIAAASIGGFGICYVALAWASRRLLLRNSQKIADEQTRLFKALQEGLGGIRDVLLDGTQPVYCDIYRRADQPLRRAQADNTVITASPRFAMETLGMVLIAALAFWLSGQEGGVISALPVLGGLALAAQRILPSLQQSYSAWATITGSYASLKDTISLIEQPLPREASDPMPEPLLLQRSLSMSSVSFRYTEDGPFILKDLNIEIPRGSRVGFVGKTGSGKSTTLDLVMGLLIPTQGSLLVDGKEISGASVRAWQRTIAHVPQTIYLADSTFAENIAFGVPKSEIDIERIKVAAKRAHIADFIEDKENGYDELVGERGIKLSGGQRQRIGIARALYKQASVLIFDEATSALDSVTENSVMQAINALDHDLTILLIAHRLSTVKGCDMLIEMDQGRIVGVGTYDQLMERSGAFISAA